MIGCHKAADLVFCTAGRWAMVGLFGLGHCLGEGQHEAQPPFLPFLVSR